MKFANGRKVLSGASHGSRDTKRQVPGSQLSRQVFNFLLTILGEGDSDVGKSRYRRSDSIFMPAFLLCRMLPEPSLLAPVHGQPARVQSASQLRQILVLRPHADHWLKKAAPDTILLRSCTLDSIYQCGLWVFSLEDLLIRSVDDRLVSANRNHKLNEVPQAVSFRKNRRIDMFGVSNVCRARVVRG